jgi:hypothetical protein
MDKPLTSRKQPRACFSACVALVLSFTVLPPALHAITLSKTEASRIGKKIWQNECNGTIAGLTSWNAGEDFASLGIGHFIWYAEGKRGPFEESFPKLVTFISDHDVEVPAWLRPPRSCPWSSRAAFERAQNSAEMTQLRSLLARTVDLQAQFLVDRLEHALPKMLEETAPGNRTRVEQQFERVASSPQGCYALVDYVNFKGEGVLHTERYRGQGWGLLQVLEEMHGTSNGPEAVEEFSRAVKAILIRRVKNSPPERGESRWLPGWLNRVNSYGAS